METIITSREAYDKHNQLLENVVLQIQQFTSGKIIDFNENGFEDMSNNDVCGIGDESVYIESFKENYPIHELDLLDAIKILGDLEHLASNGEIEYTDETTIK